MTVAPPDPAEPIAGGPALQANPALAAWALLVGIALLMAGNGLQGSLIGVRGESEGFSVVAIGIVMACYFLGFLGGAKYAEYLLGQVGHIRVFAALASLASAAVLFHAVVVSAVSWGLMRFVTGACMAGLYVVSESWLNDMATNATRGRLLSMYMVATMGGMTAGQFLLEAADPGGFRLFVVASILVSVSLVPVTLSASSNPPLSVPEPLSFRELVREVPTGVFTSFWVGTSAGVLMGLSAVFAVQAGVPAGRLSLFLAAPLAGSVVMQWPIGWVSDRISRRTVMWWVATAASAICVILALAPPGGWGAIALMFLLGGTMFPLYSLSIAFTGDWLPASKLTSASAVLVRVNGIGAVFGPLLAAPLMAVTAPDAFYWTMALTHGVIATYIAWRVVVREGLPLDQQGAFVAFPARASAVAIGLVARGRRAPAAEETEAHGEGSRRHH